MAEEDKKKKEEDAQHPPAKSSKKLLFIIIGAVVVVLIGAGAFFFLFSKKGSDASQTKEAHEETAKHTAETKGGHKSEAGGTGEVLALEPFIVNLQDNTGTRYLKVTVNLEMDGKAVEEAKAKTAHIKDSIIILLSSKGYSDVGTVQGKYQLRDEIAGRANQILNRGKVKAVYFTEFVIQ